MSRDGDASKSPEEATPWEIKLTKRAIKDLKWLKEDGTHWEKVVELMDTIETNPFERSQGYKALKGKRKGQYERRISKQFRIIYSIEKVVKIVRILSAKNHT